MMAVLFWLGMIGGGFGLGFVAALWMVSRVDSALSVTVRRDRQ